MTDSKSGPSAENRPYLGDPQVIGKLLQNIARETIQCRIASKQGILSPEDANAIEEKEATAAARALLGRDKKYAVDANWNVPGVIDAFIKEELNLEEKGPEPIVVAGLMRFVREIHTRLNLLEDPKQNPTAENEIQDIIEKYRNVLLGLSVVVPAPEAELASGTPMIEAPAPVVLEPPVFQPPATPPPAKIAPPAPPTPVVPKFEPKLPPQADTPVVMPMPASSPSQPESARSGGGLKWAALLILLLVIGGGVTFFVLRKPEPPIVLEKPAVKPIPVKITATAPVLNSSGTIDLIDETGKTVRTISMQNRKMIIHLFDFARVNGKTSFLVSTESAEDNYDLWIIDEAGDGRLVHATVLEGKFSPDASQLAYTTAEHTLIAEEATGKKLASTEGVLDFTWSAEGNAIVFFQSGDQNSVNLAQLTLADQKITTITGGLFDNAMPAMHPNGKEIFLVAGTATGLPSFWKIAAAGGEPQQVTNVRLDETNDAWIPTPFSTAQWSTDGRWLIYDFKDGHVEQIWGLEFDDTGNFKRAIHIAEGLVPRWISAGKFVCLKTVNGTLEASVQTVPSF